MAPNVTGEPDADPDELPLEDVELELQAARVPTQMTPTAAATAWRERSRMVLPSSPVVPLDETTFRSRRYV
jgi:hypothetical protein